MKILGKGYRPTFELLEYTADAVMMCRLLWHPHVEKTHSPLSKALWYTTLWANT